MTRTPRQATVVPAPARDGDTAHGFARAGLRLALTLAALALATGSACRRAREGDRERPAPNILLVTLDTVRADHVSSDGRSPVATPNLDGLARRGARFTRAFAQVPLTTPSHASLLTGVHPSVHGIRDNDSESSGNASRRT